MYDKIVDIKGAIQTFRNDTVFLETRRRWEKDFNLWRLQPYDAGKGYYAYTTNAPRVFADKVITLLAAAKLLIRVPLDVLTDEQRRTASNLERFWYGVLNLNDERMEGLGMPSIRDQMAWYAAIRGAFCKRDYVYKNDKGDTIPAIDIWDIYNCAYGQGKDGLLWAAHMRKMTKEQVKDEFGLDITPGGTENLIDTIDYWDKEKFGIIVRSQWGLELKPHGLDYNPVSLVRVGALPPIWQENYQYTGAYVGESVYASVRDLYPLLSKTMSDHLTVVRRGVKPPMGYWSGSGTKTLDQDIWQVEKGHLIPMEFGEEIKPVIEASMPADTAPLLQMISGEIQRGTFAHTTYGELGFRLSGFAISQLQAAVETVVLPLLGAMTKSYESSCRNIQNQFVEGKFSPIYVRGRTSRNEAFGMPTAQKLKPSDLEGEWHPEVRLEPMLPKDDAQRFYLANLARQGEKPLLSDKTIMDELIGVEDPDLENEQINLEWAKKLPIVMLYEAYLRALSDGRQDIAENILAELHRLFAQMGGGTAPTGGGAVPSGLEQMVGETEGVGMPPGETGLPSSEMPSEMLGGMPGGAMSAKMPVEGEI